MDGLSRQTRQRWNALAAAGVQYSRPWLDLNAAEARRRVDPLGLLGDLAGRRVLCLAGGGGQQSAAFGLLGAEVTVLDLSDEMLARDHEAADHYGLSTRTVQGDARELGAMGLGSFDVIWHAHSLTFIPQIEPVFDGVAGCLRAGGVYHLSCWNPLAHGADQHWTGQGYLLREPYVEGAEAVDADPFWDIDSPAGPDAPKQRVAGPREFRHTLTAVLNGLIGRGFVLLDVHEEPWGDPAAEPGSWGHFCTIAPPWLALWAARRPDLLAEARGGQ